MFTFCPVDSEEGLVVLQTLVEGMVLEAHVSSGQTSDILDTSAVPLVELYTQFGSQVGVEWNGLLHFRA